MANLQLLLAVAILTVAVGLVAGDCCQNCCQNSCQNDCQESCQQNCHCQVNCQQNCCSQNSCQQQNCQQNCQQNECSHVSTSNTSKSDTINIDNLHNEDVNLTNVINITNTVNNVNKIDMPVTVDVVNHNNLISFSRPNYNSLSENIEKDNIRIVEKPYPVPFRIPIQIPYPVPYPIVQQRPCCQVISPCLGYGCPQTQQYCGNICTSNYMYQPTNPCPTGGCRRRRFAQKSFLGDQNGGFIQKCSECKEDFYKTFETYIKCRACFY